MVVFTVDPAISYYFKLIIISFTRKLNYKKPILQAIFYI